MMSRILNMRLVISQPPPAGRMVEEENTSRETLVWSVVMIGAGLFFLVFGGDMAIGMRFTDLNLLSGTTFGIVALLIGGLGLAAELLPGG